MAAAFGAMPSASAISLGMCLVATVAVTVMGWLHARRMRLQRESQQREIDAVHAEIAHTARVDGVENASKIVNLVYSQQLEQMDAEQRSQAEMLKSDPVAMAKYIQAIVDEEKNA